MIDAPILRQIRRESGAAALHEAILSNLVENLNEEPPESISRLVRALTNIKVLNRASFQAARVTSMDEFEAKLKEMVPKR